MMNKKTKIINSHSDGFEESPVSFNHLLSDESLFDLGHLRELVTTMSPNGYFISLGAESNNTPFYAKDVDKGIKAKF